MLLHLEGILHCFIHNMRGKEISSVCSWRAEKSLITWHRWEIDALAMMNTLSPSLVDVCDTIRSFQLLKRSVDRWWIWLPCSKALLDMLEPCCIEPCIQWHRVCIQCVVEIWVSVACYVEWVWRMHGVALYRSVLLLQWKPTAACLINTIVCQWTSCCSNNNVTVIEFCHLSVLALMNTSVADDTVDDEILLKRLDLTFYIRGGTLKLFTSHLTDRIEHVNIGNDSSPPLPSKYARPQVSVFWSTSLHFLHGILCSVFICWWL